MTDAGHTNNDSEGFPQTSDHQQIQPSNVALRVTKKEEDNRQINILLGESIGTFILLLAGLGGAMFAAQGGDSTSIGTLGVALCFGFGAFIAIMSFGVKTGSHLNPAVTLALWLRKKVVGSDTPYYIAGQFLGGAAATGVVWGIARGTPAFDTAKTFSQVSNGFGSCAPKIINSTVEIISSTPKVPSCSPSWQISGGFSWISVGLAEFVFTGLLVLVVLLVKDHGLSMLHQAIAVSSTIALAHLVTIPVDGTSINPVRSIFPALLAGTGAIGQLWVFIVFPIAGAAAAGYSSKWMSRVSQT